MRTQSLHLLQGQESLPVSSLSLAFILLFAHDESSHEERSVRLPFSQLVLVYLGLLDVLASFVLDKICFKKKVFNLCFKHLKQSRKH